MAEVVEARDLTTPAQHGWAVDYRIRRDDGEELHAEVRCWEKAHAAAERAASTDALAAIADRGSAAALEYAEVVESPATRGAALISIWFDLRTRAISAGASATSADPSSDHPDRVRNAANCVRAFALSGRWRGRERALASQV